MLFKDHAILTYSDIKTHFKIHIKKLRKQYFPQKSLIMIFKGKRGLKENKICEFW